MAISYVFEQDNVNGGETILPQAIPTAHLMDARRNMEGKGMQIDSKAVINIIGAVGVIMAFLWLLVAPAFFPAYQPAQQLLVAVIGLAGALFGGNLANYSSQLGKAAGAAAASVADVADEKKSEPGLVIK